MSTPTVSIIIRCYNEEEHIGRLLMGIYSQSEIEFEVIVVDSGSTDRTLNIARQYPVRIMNIDKEDFSFGYSLNIGCSAAKGEYLTFISAHCYPVRTSWLRKLLEPMQNPEVALSYGKQRGNDKTTFSEHQVFTKWFPDVSNQIQRTPFCNNANAAIKRSLWKKYPYNEEITGLEDLDWAKNIIEKGYCLSYTVEAEVIHVHNERPVQTFNRYYREAIAFHQIFPQQKFTVTDLLKLSLINVVADYFQALNQGQFLNNLLRIPVFRLMQFVGTYRGYRKKSITESLKSRFYYPPELSKAGVGIEETAAVEKDHINYSELSGSVDR